MNGALKTRAEGTDFFDTDLVVIRLVAPNQRDLTQLGSSVGSVSSAG
jgi:hypothetical protein